MKLKLNFKDKILKPRRWIEKIKENREGKRAAELIIANKELAFQTEEKADRAAELIIANKELAFQTEEKADRAAELIIANKELAFQTEEKGKRAAELIIANKELAFQTEEKGKRAAELIIADKELAFQTKEKADRAAELIIANKELALAHTFRLSTLGEMASAMAHEINQPLSIISLVSESIFRDIEKDRIDISLLPKDLKDILHSIKRIDRIITHMQTFARQPGEWKLIEPEQMLDNAFIILGEQFRVHGIIVSRHIEKNLPPIETDPNQLEQVFINILINADQVLDEKKSQKGELGESFQKQIVINIFQEGEDVVFEFADNGYGVPDEIKSRIFEPFFTTKEMGKGTGLGLSIAYSILNQSLKGRIRVEDNQMRGASFKVAIPVDPSYKKEKK